MDIVNISIVRNIFKKILKTIK